jgi:predicted small lipoprotein YifL
VRRVLITLVLLGLLAGCGEEGPHYELTTPPPSAGAFPLEPKGRAKLEDRPMTQADALKLRTSIKGWADAVARGDLETASDYFDLPTIVSQPGQPIIELRTPAVAKAFNVSLSCALRLISVKPDGRYVIGAFFNDTLEGRTCPAAGGVSRIGFVFGDPEHPKRFTEWWEAKPGTNGEDNPPTRPTDALPVAPLQLVPRG